MQQLPAAGRGGKPGARHASSSRSCCLHDVCLVALLLPAEHSQLAAYLQPGRRMKDITLLQQHAVQQQAADPNQESRGSALQAGDDLAAGLAGTSGLLPLILASRASPSCRAWQLACSLRCHTVSWCLASPSLSAWTRDHWLIDCLLMPLQQLKCSRCTAQAVAPLDEIFRQSAACPAACLATSRAEAAA